MERSKALDRDGQVIGTVPQVDLHDVAEAMRSLSIDVAPNEPDSPLQRLVSVAVERVPGTRWASVEPPSRRPVHHSCLHRRGSNTRRRRCSTNSGPARAWTRLWTTRST